MSAGTYRQVTVQKPKKSPYIFWLGFFIFLLLAFPKTRIVFAGIPIYLLDVILIFLLLNASGKTRDNLSTFKSITTTATVYLIFVILGEMNGMLAYSSFTQSIYMTTRFGLAISLIFTLPKYINSSVDVEIVVKGVLLGLFVSSIIAIGYSLPLTRPYLMSTVFSWNFLSPGAENLAFKTLMNAGVDEATRGRSLVGAATMTTGFLGFAWPISFLASRWRGFDPKWKKYAVGISVLTPLAILMTYGRVAWLTVAALGSLIAIFGFAGGRRNIIVLVVLCAGVVNYFGIDSKLFMVDRIVIRTEMALDAPYEGESERERFLSYIEPFEHLAKNPSWLVIGVGKTGEKLLRRGSIKEQLYDQVGLATHSAFAISYYAFGVPGAACQILLVFFGFRLIVQKVLRQKKGKNIDQQLFWQSFFMAWCGYLIWWSAGHACVGEPRGVMLVFFMYGFMIACGRLWLIHDQSVEISRKRRE